MSITYCECVFVALGIRLVIRMRRIAICGLPRSTISKRFSKICRNYIFATSPHFQYNRSLHWSQTFCLA